ncbi:MAG: hypothetical protein ACPGHX_07295 [Candidatus Puniceispirillaceae bacterium]
MMPDSLPSWDLSDLYDDKGTAAQDDLAQVQQRAKKLAEFSGKLTGKTGDELAGIITEYQASHSISQTAAGDLWT